MSVPVLRAVAVEPTNHCNLSCSICWSQNPSLYPPRPKGYMDFGLYKDIVEQLKAYIRHTRTPIFLGLNYGGEGLLHPRFGEMLEYALSRRCFNVQVITNGLLLDRYADLLRRGDISLIISYHRVPNQDGLIEGIRRIIQSKGLNRFQIAVVEGEFTEEELDGVKRKFPGIGSRLVVYPLITEDLQYEKRPRKTGPCPSPYQYMAVLWNGDTWPCCRLLSSDFPSLGNVAEDGVLGVWEGEGFTNLRRHPEAYPCAGCGVR